MDRHPFFMKEPPKPGQELHPLMEGLQALKYDPDENEPEGIYRQLIIALNNTNIQILK